MQTLKIGPNVDILMGTKAGEDERTRLDFDRIDNSNEEVIVEIDTTAVLSDFIRALVAPSVRKLGFAKFERKYRFDAAPSVRENIMENARAVAEGF